MSSDSRAGLPAPGEPAAQTVYAVSHEAFTLAREAAVGEGDAAARERQARVLNSRLDELWPLVQAAPDNERPGLNQAWTDARLDLGYILSGGELPTSTRLHYALADLRRARS